MISPVDIPNGMRANMTIGEVNGITESQKANVELGSFATDMAIISPSMMGIMTIDCSCPASCILSTADPMAANIAE